MFKYLDIDLSKVYPMIVVSTMSSGKSTLINSLIGEDILPSQNEACTAKATVILDNDNSSKFIVHYVDEDGNYYKQDANNKIVSNYNKNNRIKELIIEGQVRGIKNSIKSLMIIDTPGINNVSDSNHEIVTKNIVDQFDEGLILYILNAEQLGTYDDNYFLEYISKKIDNKKYNILFALNRMDAVDSNKESPIEMLNNCKKYVESKGIINPTIIPVSARSSLLFKKLIFDKELTEMEEEDFFRYYKRFKNDSYSLNKYIINPMRPNINASVEVDGDLYKKSDLYEALDNTGLSYLEMVIDELLVRSLKMESPVVGYSKNILSLTDTCDEINKAPQNDKKCQKLLQRDELRVKRKEE